MNAIWRGLAVAALGLGASVAQAGGINWSIGINLPPVATVISNDPYHRPYYEPAPVYAPPPVVLPAGPGLPCAPPPVVYRPVPIAVAPAYVVEPHWAPPRHEWRHHRGHGQGNGYGGHGGHRWRDRDDYRRGHGH